VQRNETALTFDPIVDGGCDGSAACKAERHIHGCFADRLGNCDHPSEHLRVRVEPQESGGVRFVR
jgi:hypothetical protein